MTCPDCTQARASMWHGYRSGCAECRARAVARGPQAFDAIGQRNSDVMRDLIRRAMPETDPAEARRMVWAWWQHDHQDRSPRP